MERVEFDRLVEMVNTRVIRKYDATEVVKDVFANQSPGFVLALTNLAELGIEVEVGGRRIRDLVGCRTLDVRLPTATRLQLVDPSKVVRIAPLYQVLKNYPYQRLDKPDLDLFTRNGSLDTIASVLEQYGFKPERHSASGGIDALVATGKNGSASIIDSAQSWQTNAPWPVFGFRAKFEQATTPKFDLNISAARLYAYPLSLQGIEAFKPDSPKRVAATGRALLWSMTATTPDNALLPLPDDLSMKSIVETAEHVAPIIDAANASANVERTFRGGIRDYALALALIETADYLDLTGQRGDFWGRVSVAYWTGRQYKKTAK